jgi:hypothetical protein
MYTSGTVFLSSTVNSTTGVNSNSSISSDTTTLTFSLKYFIIVLIVGVIIVMGLGCFLTWLIHKIIYGYKARNFDKVHSEKTT